MFIVYLLVFNIIMMSGLLLHNLMNLRQIKIKSRELSLVVGKHADLSMYLLKKEMRVCFLWSGVFVAFLIFFSVSLCGILN